MKIISMWSGPRNVSTAMMYSFAQRSDTSVIDEPLYAHYLKNVEVTHPGDHEVLHNMENDGERVLENILTQKVSTPNLFLKNMAHHWVGLNDEFLRKFTNIFLIRHPGEMLTSLIKKIPSPVIRDTGLKMQVELFKKLNDKPVIVESSELLKNPKNILSQLCQKMGLPFEEAMLKWKSGPKSEDGIWAKYWYHNVHKSEGFAPYNPKNTTLPERHHALLEECLPYYNYLLDKSIKN